MSPRAPVVGIPCDHRLVGKHAFHLVGEKYIAAVRDGSQALPLLVPVLDPALPVAELVAAFDGFLFTGAVSNVAPKHYGGPEPREGVLQDERRDETTLPLLKAAIAAAKPVLCVCRGFQELNVAFGGTLHQHVHELEGRLDHREDTDAPLETQYGPVHAIQIEPGCLFADIVGAGVFQVNSLHGQAIDRLAPSLHADATASDGTIEAVSMPGAKAFLLGVQWHPEWRWWEDELSRAIFGAFGEALRERVR
ncbi:MAG: gamma-glutamyl-gamma-aminobutyrate hydrolase family protein [Alphaproteobacteria bacterium]|nr:gamma-glutamyl-gamma-aminobutyrate hydrolase family protein [Alphaproteobacteria bacterium]